MPSSKNIADIKANLLHPATTSHFEVEIPRPRSLTDKFLSDNGLNLNPLNQSKLKLLCCEASLPGSNLATLELTNDHTGVTERHAYRRVYDDRIDLTFYVDAENCLPIRFFEIWMKYITQESVAKREGLSSRDKNYFYRFNYPDNYTVDEGLKIHKFERSSFSGSKGKKASILTYEFIRAFPISISSMPVSYDSSSLLKCTVSMTYIRYIVESLTDPPAEQEQNSVPSTPIEQASWNNAPDYFLNPQFGVEGIQGTSNPQNTITSNERIQQLEQSFGSDTRAIPFNTNKLSREVTRRTPPGPNASRSGLA
jgi:hypothetical protein